MQNWFWVHVIRERIKSFLNADDTTLMAESEEELKSLLMKVKEESEKAGESGRSACGPTHVARLEFPRETGLILRCTGKAGNPF